MNLIRSRTRNGVNNASHVPAELSAERIRLHAKLLKSIRVRHRVGSVAVMIVVLRAIQNIVRRVGASSIYSYRGYARIGCSRSYVGILIVGLHSRHQLHELCWVTAV